MKKIFIKLIKVSGLVLLCLFLTLNGQTSFAQNASLKETANQNIITFYPGTLFKAILQQRISTEVNNVGDKVKLITPTDINLGENVCIPQDSKFFGRIVKLERPKIGSNGSFQIIFDTLSLPEGQNIKIMASVWTKKGDGTVGGEATKRSMFRPVVHSVDEIGRYVQQLPAGPREMGKDTELLPGTEVLIVLDKQLVLSVPKE